MHPDKHDPLHLPNSGRKRKLQLEQLGLPMSKHKVRHQLVPDDSSEGSMDASEADLESILRVEETEGSSFKGSRSSTMENLKDHGEMSPTIFVPHFEPPASPSNPKGSDFKDSPYSSDGRVVKNNKGWGRQLPVLDANHGVDEPDCRLAVPGADEGEDEFMEEECLDERAQELMLSCCDDVGLHTLALSSARWSIEQDALPGAVRPTIDQEFEQHLSMFML